jgi:hypothetical protein
LQQLLLDVGLLLLLLLLLGCIRGIVLLLSPCCIAAWLLLLLLGLAACTRLVAHAGLHTLLLAFVSGGSLLLRLLLLRSCRRAILIHGVRCLLQLLLLLLSIAAALHTSLLLLCRLLLCGRGQSLRGARQLLLVLPQKLVLISSRRLVPGAVVTSVGSCCSTLGLRLQLLLLLGRVMLHSQVGLPALKGITQAPEWVEVWLAGPAPPPLLLLRLLVLLVLLLRAALLLQRRNLPLLAGACGAQHGLVCSVSCVLLLLLLLRPVHWL